VARAFAGTGWRVPQLMAAMRQAPDFYFDTVTQVHLDRWSAGRAAFGRYERLLRPYVAKGQKQARGGKDFLAPPTAKKIAQLQRIYQMLPYLPVKRLMKYLTTCTAAGIKLPATPLRKTDHERKGGAYGRFSSCARNARRRGGSSSGASL
jgi:hypothetical protein